MKGIAAILGLGLCACWASVACGNEDSGGGANGGGTNGVGANSGEAGAHDSAGGTSQGGGGKSQTGGGTSATSDGGTGGESPSAVGGEGGKSSGGTGNTVTEGGASGSGSDVVGDAGSGGMASGTDGGAGGAAPQDVGPNLVFATSQVWAAQNLGGLEGADAKCQAAAQDAKLPGTYVAWLSDSTHDAKTRLGSARGWVRTDGKPFADTVANIIAGKHYYTPNVDEHGARINLLSSAVLTGTQANGTKSGGNYCVNYTAADAGSVSRGNLNRYDARWTKVDEALACNTPAHLYCFEIDHQDPVAAKFPASRKVFVSKEAPRNDMGIGNFDTTCTTEATKAGLTGTFKAFVSTTAEAASARFNLNGSTFARVDGVPVVNAAADIAAAISLLEPIDLGADGSEMAPGNRIVFTGSTAPNKKGTNAETCDNWSKSVFDKSARTGQPTSADAAWWVYTSDWHCNTWLHVYCVEE